MFEPGLIQALDAFGHEQIAVGDESGDHAALANVANHFVEIGMKERFASADGDDGGAEAREIVEAALHFFERNWIREIVELIAIGAGKIASAHGNNVRENWRARGNSAPRQLADFAQTSAPVAQTAP